MSKARTKWLVIGWVALATIFACVLVPFNIPRIVDILRHEASVTGTVTAPDCSNHNSVRYSFDFGGKPYAGFFPVDGPCGSLKAGSPITVYFSTVSPEKNEIREPARDLWNEIITIALVCLTFPTIIVWRLNRTWGRSRDGNARET
jgi:hypothetical protein